MCLLESPDTCVSWGREPQGRSVQMDHVPRSWLLLGDPVARSIHHAHWALSSHINSCDAFALLTQHPPAMQ